MGPPDNSRVRIDTSSIRTSTMASFVLFAVILVAILWGLMSFGRNSYYGRIRTQGVIRTANGLATAYKESPGNFDKFMLSASNDNGIYIRLDEGDMSMSCDATGVVEDTEVFDQDIENISAMLAASDEDSVSLTTRNTAGEANSRLVYAERIYSRGSEAVLYIIAPLYPDEATMRIITNMLSYITIIIFAIAMMLAYALSGRIVGPIEDITRSAMELSKGNYNVKFDGANFTETKELAKALNKASYEMEKTDYYQREIIANVSHDLKTPLTMIRSYAEKIIDISGDNPEKRNADLNIIITETEHLNRLVTDMMSVSNLQSNNVELHKETFDFVEAAREVYESFQVLASTEGYDLHFHPCKPSYVVGDRTRLMQVMTNFVSNAVKYSSDNKYIDVQVIKTGRKVAFHCIDHGVGIPSDEISHVWDKYYRTSANHDRDIEGTGLGLAIAKGILTLHNANYGVNSEEGKGSDFWFELDTVRKPQQKSRSDRNDKNEEDK